ncbi:MAG: ureidoglycolate lyase [Bacillota bacterium]
MRKKLEVEKITAEKFADYGTLVTMQDNQPNEDLEADIFTLYSHLASHNFESEIIFNLLEVIDREKTFSSLERHVETKEYFMALDRDVVVLVGKPDNSKDYPEADTVRAFHLSAGEGILMDEGTWHWIPYPLNAETANMLVVFKKGTLEDDLVVEDLCELEDITFELEM